MGQRILKQSTCLDTGNSIDGVFTVTGCDFRTSVNQHDYLRLSLESAYESITANCWLNSYIGPTSFNDNETVRVTGNKKRLDFKEIADIHTANVVRPIDIDALTSIPKSYVTNPDDLHVLIELVSSIYTEPLRNYIYEVFSDRNFALQFCTLPASHTCHHSDKGGLLKHSLECAEIVALCPYLSPVDRDLGVVAALLHDAGKTLTMMANKKTQLGYLVDHDSLTLEALHRPLSWLDQVWPDAGIALRHIWTCRSPKHFGFKEKMPIAVLVQMADRISADLNTQNNLFSAAESWRNNVRHPITDQRFWRPSEAAIPNSFSESLSYSAQWR